MCTRKRQGGDSDSLDLKPTDLRRIGRHANHSTCASTSRVLFCFYGRLHGQIIGQPGVCLSIAGPGAKIRAKCARPIPGGILHSTADVAEIRGRAWA